MSLSPVIVTVDVVKERDAAIEKMVAALENPKLGHKRAFQKLPKHLRRRAMSYDVRKVPRNMRDGVAQQLAGAMEAKIRNKPSGRENTPFRPHSKALACHRNEDHKWLESHLWHAKRFFMGNLWGWKIPLAPTMKGTRSLIRQTAENCTACDISYFDIISISMPHSEIIELLQHMTFPDVYIESRIHTLFQFQFHKINQNTSHNFQIGPAYLVWASEDHLWIFTHPLITSDIASQFPNSHIHSGEYNIFELLGPRSSQVIFSALPPAPSTPLLTSSTLYNLPPPGAIPPGFSIAYTALDPRSSPPLFEDSKENPQPTSEIINLDQIKATTPIDIFSIIPPELGDSELYSTSVVKFKSDTDFNEERAKLLFPSVEQTGSPIPVLALQMGSGDPHGFGCGWFLVFPFGCGAAVWRKIIKTGARPFGVELAKHIDLEKGIFSFPFSRPDTEEGFKQLTKDIEEFIAINDSKPPGKRLNLDLFRFPQNFVIFSKDQFEEASSHSPDEVFTKVKILMARRGTPSRFSTIYIPDEADYSKVNTNEQIVGMRNPCGIVMDGNSSLLAGEGKGLGIMNLTVIKDVLMDQEAKIGFTFTKRPPGSFIALIREQGSQFFHTAWVSIY